MILKISLRAKGGVAKTLLEQKHRLNFLYFPQNTLMLTESREEFSDLHSIFRLRALRYWGKRSDASKIVLSSSTITNAYNEIVRWKKNVFLVPYGKIGREFIDQVTSHINDWNNSSDNRPFYSCLLGDLAFEWQ